MEKLLESFNTIIAINLGSSNTRICHNDKGVLLKEPSLVAVDKRFSPPRVIETGIAAKNLLGRSKGDIKTLSPLKRGVIAEMDLTVALLKSFIDKVLTTRIIKFAPQIVLTIPTNATGVEKKAAYDSLKFAGAKKAWLIEEPLAAAVGAGVNINSPNASMIVDIGGGSTDISIISLGDIAVNNNVRVAGDDFDRAIQNYIRTKNHLIIGDRTAEELKIKYGSLSQLDKDEAIEVKGIDIFKKSPSRVIIGKSDIREALLSPIRFISKEIYHTLESAPPELAADILDSGIILTGGSCLLNGLKEFLSTELKIPVTLAPDPMLNVVMGADVIQNDPLYRRLLITYK